MNVDIQIQIKNNSLFISKDTITVGMEEHESLLYSILENLVIELTQLKQKDLKDIKNCCFSSYSAFDYVEYRINQLDKNTVQLISQFYDGSDKSEIKCDAQSFYCGLITETKRWLDDSKNGLKSQKKYTETILHLEQLVKKLYTN